MDPIRMVDLKSQYNQIADEVQSALNDVIESTAFINGPAVKQFQANLEQYLGVNTLFHVQMELMHCKSL